MSFTRHDKHARPHAAVVCERGRHRRVRRHARALRARRADARSVARVPAGARHLRPAAGRRRADAARQDPAGHPHQRSARARWPRSARQYSRRFGHITTRQNIQFHFVKLHDVEPAMRRLADAGLTTREACGNSVRNITACPYAGVSADERSTSRRTPKALTRFLLRHPLSSTLPRKFKIAFEGCAEDHIATAINDLGFRAELAADGTRGFRVAGGRRHGDHVQVGRRAARVPAGVRDLPRRRSDAARLPAARRLPAQAAQPDEVHDQGARLGPLAAEYERELAACRGRGACRCSRSIRRRSKRSPTWARGRGAVAEPDRGARGGGAADRARHHADARAGLSCRATRRTRAGAPPTSGRRSSSAT